MRAKATSSSASAQSPGCFDRLLRTRRAFTVAQDARTGDPAPHNHRESGERRITCIILCLLLLMVPAGQILIHSLVGSGLWNLVGLGGEDINNNRQSIGILANPVDNLVYASMALQNSLGIHLTSNLYTTEPHMAAFFNLYFFGIGLLSKVLAIQPLAVMTLISFAAAPIMGYMVFLISRQQLKFGRVTSLLAVALVILGSDPSWIVYCLNLGLARIGVAYKVSIGWNFFPIDLFPVFEFVQYPYQSVALVFQIMVFSAILKALRTDVTGNPTRWILFSAAILAAFALIRPFGAFVLAALFPVTMLLSRLLRGESLLFRFSDYLIIVGLVGPCLGYLLWISSLPVWQDWSISSFHLSFITRKNLIGGFSVFWFFAIMGALRAFRERRLDMLIFCLWTFSTMLLLIGFGYRAYYVANGAVIAYGILAAFGLEHLLRHLAVYLTKYGQRGQAIFRNLGATAAALFMIGTSLCWYRMALDFETPRIDTEILAAAALIRQESANSIPIVLTDCSTASALPGLAAARVYSGHYGLTHDFSARCRELRLGGFEDEERSSPAPSFDESRLRDIVAKIKPDFVLIRRGASAEQWLLAHHAAASANMTGQRWSLLVAGK